jgi:hypothetical protein
VHDSSVLALVLLVPTFFVLSVAIFFVARLGKDRPATTSPDGLRADFDAMVERVQRGQHESADAFGQKLLAFCRRQEDVQTICALFAISAETQGDFEACEGWTRRAQATGAKAIEPRILASRRAFCLAALDRLDAEEHELPPSDDDGLVVRAHVLVASKRGDHVCVDELLRGTSLGANFGPKSRALLDALRDHSLRATSHAAPYRTAADTLDPETTQWLLRAAATSAGDPPP